MKLTREGHFIKLFLSAYENFSWADAALEKPDAVDRTNPAVDQIATRKSDGKKLAIEHTIVEPFVGDKADFASFDKWFLEIEKDESLLVPGCWIRVFVPVGTLQNQPPKSREAIVQSVHSWIKLNRCVLREGILQHSCPIDRSPFDVVLSIEVVPLQSGSLAERGCLHVRRQQVKNDLGDVVEKALKEKVPKLASTPAGKRILLLERQHMNLWPEHMLKEIEKRRSSFPALAVIDEIWVLETIVYNTDFGETYCRFSLYEGTEVVRHFGFEGGKLVTKSEDGVGEVIRTVGDV